MIPQKSSPLAVAACIILILATAAGTAFVTQPDILDNIVLAPSAAAKTNNNESEAAPDVMQSKASAFIGPDTIANVVEKSAKAVVKPDSVVQNRIGIHAGQT